MSGHPHPRQPRQSVIGYIIACLLFCFSIEAAAVRPPLKPMGIDNLRQMVCDAEVIATGTVSSVTRSKTLQQSREISLIRVVITADRILKGDKAEKTITIEESYRQFSSEDVHGKDITASRTGPAPPVGLYREGDQILVFLKSIDGSNLYCPLGSGDHDAYLGVFHLISGNIVSDRFEFGDNVSAYSSNDKGLFALIASMTGEQRCSF